MLRIVPLSAIAAAAVETLLDAAFGADRHGRTAYRLREGVSAIDALSFAVLDGDQLVGSIQCWPVALLAANGRLTAMTLVGPVAVLPERQGRGVGRLLMQASLGAAGRLGHDALMMVGDPEYYGRFFWFSAERTAGWSLPGPVDRRRVLARVDRPGGVPKAGAVIPDPAFASGGAAA